jgi:hypothetical protein
MSFSAKKILILTAALGSTVAQGWGSCRPIPQSDQIWSNKSIRWVFVGELHGSNETPAAFGDLVCDALAHGRHITVALERPASEQDALEAILTTKDLPAARETLLDQPGWKNGMDGRASEAMFHLLLTMRDLRDSFPDLNVFAFEGPFEETSPGARDEVMGHALLSLKTKYPQDLVLVLTGNVHAMLKPMFGYDVAAMYLPQLETLSLEVTDRGGTSWFSTSDGCGPTATGMPNRGAARPFGIYLDPELAPVGKVNGIFSLDTKLTASIPAASDPGSSVDCRMKYIAKHPASSN